MTKNKAHIVFLIFDLFCIGMLWIAYSEFQRIPLEISSQVDTIRFGNRVGFFISGLGVPLIHSLSLMDFFWPNIKKKYSAIINRGIAILVAALIVIGFAGSSWLKYQVENAGYVYCWRASGSGVLAKTLAYTRDMKSCDELVASKRRKQR